MTTKHVPATALPWHSEAPMGGIRTSGYHLYTAHTSGVQNTRREDSQYIAHAANAYPGLIGEVKLLRAALQKVRHFTIGEGAPTGNDSEQAAYVRRINGCEYAARDALERESLLRSLGEDA